MTPEQHALIDEGWALSRRAANLCPEQWPEAEALWREALVKQEAAWGQDHVCLSLTLGNQASALSAQRRPKEAERIWRRVVWLAQKGRTPSASRSIRHVGFVTFALKCYASFLCSRRRRWRARRVMGVLHAFQVREISKSVLSGEEKQEALLHFACRQH